MNDGIKGGVDAIAVGIGAGVFFTDFLPLAIGGATLVLVLLRIIDLGLHIREKLARPDEGGPGD